MRLKQYGVYNIKEYEQCEYFGSIKEIAKYLELTENYINIYLTRKRKGTQKLLKCQYELIEIQNREG